MIGHEESHDFIFPSLELQPLRHALQCREAAIQVIVARHSFSDIVEQDSQKQ